MKLQIPNTISQKCRYALRAIFELALKNSYEPVKSQIIADSQAIPLRFLEIILSELRHGGFVESKRGNDGGYMLARSPKSITVGEVIEFIQGKNRKRPDNGNHSYLIGDYVFANLWQSANQAIEDIYNNVNFAELVEKELELRKEYVPNYSI
jgi:Rrf2 family protein